MWCLQLPAEAGDGNISNGSAAFDQIAGLQDYSEPSKSPLSFTVGEGQCHWCNSDSGSKTFVLWWLPCHVVYRHFQLAIIIQYTLTCITLLLRYMSSESIFRMNSYCWNNCILFISSGDQEKSSLEYCSYKNHNFANIDHKNMNDASFYW